MKGRESELYFLIIHITYVCIGNLYREREDKWLLLQKVKKTVDTEQYAASVTDGQKDGGTV